MDLRNKRIEVKIGRTLNMGNYESKRIDIGVSGDIDEFHNYDECLHILYEELDTHLAMLVYGEKK